MFMLSEEQKDVVKEGDRNHGFITVVQNANKLKVYEKLLLWTSGTTDFSIKKKLLV